MSHNSDSNPAASLQVIFEVFLIWFFPYVPATIWPWTSLYTDFFFPMARQPLGGLGRLIFRGFTITLRHTTLGSTPLDEWSARRRDLYLTTHNTHKRQTSMPPVGFEPAILVSQRPQIHALRLHDHWDRLIYGILWKKFVIPLIWFLLTKVHDNGTA
jgi:hypothetical protein